MAMDQASMPWHRSLRMTRVQSVLLAICICPQVPDIQQVLSLDITCQNTVNVMHSSFWLLPVPAFSTTSKAKSSQLLPALFVRKGAQPLPLLSFSPELIVLLMVNSNVVCIRMRLPV
eukprot:TRINITY_DN98279_c0_g1_i1.p1 TRINITY_DN98279_c0_g1~~TRINITY_DN98279_c0_g1_i1.p1  ORF type:complete len:117 (-),score=4.55 TRINITY_DN98279_c0_g1_i1:44-394(-)